jgi:two-component system, LuxR family, response regulator FixJ
MVETAPVIAVLDDESKMRSALKRLLGTHGFQVELFATGDEFLAAAERLQLPDCLLLDLHMPAPNGFEVLESLRTLGLTLPIIVITGHDEWGTAQRVIDLGASDYLLKPLAENSLISAINLALTKSTHTA